MSWQQWRHDNAWSIGWIRGRWWLNVSHGFNMYCFDVGTWRIRWEGRDFHPMFSERYGLTKVHKLGRLAFINSPRRKKR